MEEAVRREIHEEAGVTCGAVRYVTSQPWPFGGSQLMMACIADAQGDALVLDTTEIEDAMWVTKEEARAALEGASDRRFNAPPPLRLRIACEILRRNDWYAIPLRIDIVSDVVCRGASSV
jgi:NAD+ diphosphatase